MFQFLRRASNEAMACQGTLIWPIYQHIIFDIYDF